MFKFFSKKTAAKSDEEKAQDFWQWFEENEDFFFDLEPGDPNFKKSIEQLAKSIAKARDGLGFELRLEAIDGKKALHISPNGAVENISAMESLIAQAPALNNWEIGAYKQRKEKPLGAQFAGRLFDGSNVFFSLSPQDGKIDIELFFDGFKEGYSQAFGGIGFAFLDSYLGERDVMLKVGDISFGALDDAPEDADHLKALPAEFDRIVEEQNL